jgi:hypothetical protein
LDGKIELFKNSIDTYYWTSEEVLSSFIKKCRPGTIVESIKSRLLPSIQCKRTCGVESAFLTEAILCKLEKTSPIPLKNLEHPNIIEF